MSVETHAFVIIGILTIAMAIATVRLVLGPSLADRVVALDLLAVAGAAMMAVAAIAYELQGLLDISLLVAASSFVGTAAFARYIE